MRVPSRPEWQADAACRNVPVEVMVGVGRGDEFLSLRPKAAVYTQAPDIAKRHCQRCPVVVECLDEAMRNPQLLGVWGGLTDRERADRRNRSDHRRTAA